MDAAGMPPAGGPGTVHEQTLRGHEILPETRPDGDSGVSVPPHRCTPVTGAAAPAVFAPVDVPIEETTVSDTRRA